MHTRCAHIFTVNECHALVQAYRAVSVHGELADSEQANASTVTHCEQDVRPLDSDETMFPMFSWTECSLHHRLYSDGPVLQE